MNYTYILFSTLLSPKQNRRYGGSVYFDRTVRFFILFTHHPISLLFFSSAFLSTGCYFPFRTRYEFGVSFLFPWLCYTTEKTHYCLMHGCWQSFCYVYTLPTKCNRITGWFDIQWLQLQAFGESQRRYYGNIPRCHKAVSVSDMW